MRIRHKLLSGEWLTIEDPEKSWSEKIKRMKQYAKKKDADYYKLYGMMYPEYGHFINRHYGDYKKMLDMMLDIVTRFGYKNGLILEPQYQHLLPTIPPSYIAEDTAARQLGISLARLRKLIGENRFSTFRIGNLILVGKESIDRYKKDHE